MVIKWASHISIYLTCIPIKRGSQDKAFRIQRLYFHCTLSFCVKEYRGGASQTPCSVPSDRLLWVVGKTIVIFLQSPSHGGRRWYSGLVLGYVVQWSSVGLNPRYTLTTFHSLISPPSGQRLSKLLPYCPQTRRTIYASEAVVAISLAHSQHIQENINIWGVSIKNLKTYAKKQVRQVHLCLNKPTGANG